MKIEELDEAESDSDSNGQNEVVTTTMVVKRATARRVDAKRALVGAGARILFYPTLFYNLFRNKIQPQFRWWDRVDPFILLGAVPFPKDVPRLKQLGVGGVITLNEPYETLVPSALYLAHGIEHLVIPTRDYLFAPSFVDIDKAGTRVVVEQPMFIVKLGEEEARLLCSVIWLDVIRVLQVEYKHMTPTAAFEHVRSIRPRVLLAPSQWQAVQGYSRRRQGAITRSPSGDAVLITKEDLEGYHSSRDDVAAGKELAVVPRIKARPMMAMLSCLFASLKVSVVCGPVTGQLAEARAC